MENPMTHLPTPLPGSRSDLEMRAFRAWLTGHADTIAHYAHWLGGTAWAKYAERLCDIAAARIPPREMVRELHALFAGRLHGLHRHPGLPLWHLPADDPRPGDVQTIASSLARGLRILGAKGPCGTPRYSDAPVSKAVRERRERRGQGPGFRVGRPAEKRRGRAGRRPEQGLSPRHGLP